jgi:hypothetical protein
MAREARSHGAALILVTQRLSDIPDGIRSNIGLWLTLRSDSPHDMEVLYRVVPVGRLSEIVTSMPDGYALIVEADPSRLSRMKAVTSKPSAYDEAYIVRLERIMMEYRKSVEEAKKQAGAVEKPAPTEASMLQEVAVSFSQDGRTNEALKVGHVEAGAEAQDESQKYKLVQDILGRVGSIDGIRERVANIPLNVLEAFINDIRRNEWKKALPKECWSMPEEYLKYWLIEEYRGKLRATPIGRALIDSAKTVFTLRGDEDE